MCIRDSLITDLLITHQHFDHVEDACRMRQIFGCRIHAGQPYTCLLYTSMVAEIYCVGS